MIESVLRALLAVFVAYLIYWICALLITGIFLSIALAIILISLVIYLFRIFGINF